MKASEQPAFPVPDSYHPNGQIQYGHNGMTLHQYFAGQALAGIMAGPNRHLSTDLDHISMALSRADILCAAYDRHPNGGVQ